MSNKLVIISAPSGAGKTTIVHELLEHTPGLEFSISATSREQRTTEIHGEDYYFLGVKGFKNAIEKDEFLEWEEVYPDQYYGTLKKEVNRIWDKGNSVIFDIDVEGGLNLKNQFDDQALAIFIEPPSESALEERLRKRKTESEEKIKMRISKARKELAKAKQFDHVVVNDDLDVAVGKVKELVQAFLNAENN